MIQSAGRFFQSQYMRSDDCAPAKTSCRRQSLQCNLWTALLHVLHRYITHQYECLRMHGTSEERRASHSISETARRHVRNSCSFHEQQYISVFLHCPCHLAFVNVIIFHTGPGLKYASDKHSKPQGWAAELTHFGTTFTTYIGDI